MEVLGKKGKSKPSIKTTKEGRHKKDGLQNDPNAVHDIYNEDHIDPAYDKTIGDDIAFDNADK